MAFAAAIDRRCQADGTKMFRVFAPSGSLVRRVDSVGDEVVYDDERRKFITLCVPLATGPPLDSESAAGETEQVPMKPPNFEVRRKEGRKRASISRLAV